MMYPYMTLPDETEIVHSDMRQDGTVKVYIEQPILGGFRSAECILPQYEWKNISGFTEEEMAELSQVIRNNAHLILSFAKEGGFTNASGF